MTEAWHITGPVLRDGTPLPEDGVTLRMDATPIPRMRGYHACRDPLDALQYASGTTICRVRLGGEIVEHVDKLTAQERTILWRVDGEALLRRFARRCALDVIDLWDAPDVVVQYLRTGDEHLRAAAGKAAGATWSAEDATGTAAWAAWYAAEAATWSAEAATWAAARATTWAAWYAAEAATWAEAKQRNRLTSMIKEGANTSQGDTT